jgi:hypothetical protein
MAKFSSIIDQIDFLHSMYPKLEECLIVVPNKDQLSVNLEPLIIFIVNKIQYYHILRNDIIIPTFSHLLKICEELSKIIPESKKINHKTVIDTFNLVLIKPYNLFLQMFSSLREISFDIDGKYKQHLISYVINILGCNKIEGPLDEETINNLIAIFEQLQTLIINKKKLDSKIIKKNIFIAINIKNRKELLIYAAISKITKSKITKSKITKFIQIASSGRKDWLMGISSFLSDKKVMYA